MHIYVPKFRAVERIVTLPTGERVRVTVDDSGTVTQIEHNHTLDAVVRPRTVTIKRRMPSDDVSR